MSKIAATAATLHLVIEQGATFQITLTWKDEDEALIDLSGYTARMQIRETTNSDSVVLELTTESGHISLGGAAGTLQLTISATESAALSITNGVYQLEVIDTANFVTRLLKGNVYVDPEVTR